MGTNMNGKQVAEAITRMKILGIYDGTIRQFEEDGLVSLSEPPLGAFFWVDDETKARIQAFEAEYNALVYVGIRSYTNIGKMDSFLYVSSYEEEWAQDRENLTMADTEGVIAYVYNHDAPECSEIGYIGVARTDAAGLRRTW